MNAKLTFKSPLGTVWVKPEHIIAVEIASQQAWVRIISGHEYETTPGEAERLLIALNDDKEKVKS